MIPPLLPYACAALIVFAATGCAARRGSPPRAKTPPRESRLREERAPTVGMTKAELLARYGKPRRRVLTEEGERWYFVLNAAEVKRKALNPLVLTPPRYRTGVVVFDAQGRVKRFAWDARNN